MIAISSAVSSSISSMSAGIVSSPACRDARQRRSPAMSWYGVRSERPDEDRLEDAVLADRGGQLVERRLVEDQPRLLGVRLDVVDRDDADADRPRRAVRRQQADDGGRELACPRTAAARPRRGNQFGPRSITSRASSR